METYNKEHNRNHSMHLFIKTVVWTLVAFALIAIGYFGAAFIAKAL